jgi:hypothetical protein
MEFKVYSKIFIRFLYFFLPIWPISKIFNSMFNFFNLIANQFQAQIMKTHNYSFKYFAKLQAQDLEGNQIQILNESKKTNCFKFCSIYFC